MSKQNILFLTVTLLILIAGYSPLIWMDAHILLPLTAEDGLIENAAALFFLAAAVIFFILFRKVKTGNDFLIFTTRRNVFFLLLSIIFLLATGEEISWGQRILNYQTPALFQERNVQQEVNIHNLDLFHGVDAGGERKSFWKLFLNIDRLFSLFWFGFCLVVPALYHLSLSLRKFIDRLQIPLIPLGLGACFLLNYLLSKMLERLFSEDAMLSAITEIKETHFAFLFMVAAVWLWTGRSKHRDQIAMR